MDASMFDSYSQYYDMIYSDKDYMAEIRYIEDLLGRYKISGNRLLELGSGTGKHGSLLAERGYDVTGIERAPEMAAQAASADRFVCQVDDICTVKLGCCFDAVLALFHVISYQVTNQSVRAVFDRASEHLLAGGLFIFDVWYTPAVYEQQPSVRIMRLERDGVKIIRIAEPDLHSNANRVDVHYTILVEDLINGKINTLTEVHPMRHFSIPELEFIAATAGFELVGAEGFLNGAKPSSNTWGVCLVLRKK